MSKIIVLGAGMAGLLAGAMLRSDCKRIVEAQESLPNNHSAVLRFRSPIVGDVLGIEFKRVHVMKATVRWRNPVADALSYSKKTNGIYTLRSSISATGKIEERFIAPVDLIQRMADRIQAPVELNQKVSGSEWFGLKAWSSVEERIFISTMPMPALMRILDYPYFDDIEFQSRNGANINAHLRGVNAYATLYVPDPAIPFNRISLTGDRLTVEFSGQDAAKVSFDASEYLNQAVDLLGIDRKSLTSNISCSDQKYAKILPIDEDERKRFMIWATTKYNIYSLGRFATWRPHLLLDDIVNDVRVIQRLINAGHSYDQRKS